ncbi:MAG: Bax inhibitor-1 family protein [Bacilli bacterium]|nr:Bax inhibitor-1 family protein [Bacilli bacterium]
MNNYRTYEQETRVTEGSRFIGVVFGYAALGFLVTAAIAVLTGYLFTSVIPIDVAGDTYLALIIGASILQLVLIFWIVFGVFRRGGNMIIPFALYTIAMGILLSTLTLTMDWYLIGMTFGLTCLVFGMMAAVGYFSKVNLSGLLIVGMGLLIGSIFLSLINWFIGSDSLTWIVTFASFGAIMLITAFDVWRIKKISESGAVTKNIALYCAFSIYIDFIYMFMRIAFILSRVIRR